MSEKRDRMIRLFGRVLLEIPAVVVAVLLALAVNSWKEARSNENLSRETLANIIREIDENAETLRGNIQDNREILIEIDSILDVIILQGTDGVRLSQNMDFVILTNGAWESAKLSGAARHMEVEMLMDLSALYNLQDVYGQSSREFINRITTVENNTKENMEAIARSNINSINISIVFAESLLEGYASFKAEWVTP
jgi:hypothetical protein